MPSPVASPYAPLWALVVWMVVSAFHPLALAAAAAGADAAAAPAPAPPGSPPTRGLVIVLRPPNVDEVTRTALARVTGELTAARFQVQIVPLDPNVDPTPQVETVSPESHAVAALAIAHISDLAGDTIAIWVCDRLGRRTTIQRMALRGNDISEDAELLAVEAIELIRVSIAGLWPAPLRATPGEHPPSSHSTHTVDAPVQVPTPGSGTRPAMSLGVGIAVLQDRGLPAPQWMGSLTGTATWPSGLGVRAQVTGLGPALVLQQPEGTAAVYRQLASLGIAWTVRPHERLKVFAGALAGVERLSATGSADDPGRARSARVWSALVGVGGGVALRLASRLSLFAEMNGIFTVPPLVIRIGDTDTVSFSRPGALAHAGLQIAF